MFVKRFLHIFGKMERPAAWVMMLVGLLSFFGTLFDIIVTGDAKWATLLISLDLFVSGFSAAQDAEDNVESTASKAKG